MTRLLAGVAIVTAMVVPTLVLTGRHAPHVPAAAASSSVRQVERVFAARGISTAVDTAAPSLPAYTSLVGRAIGLPRFTIDVYRRSPVPSGRLILLADSSSGAPTRWVSAKRANVVVSWSTQGPWREQAARVRVALNELPHLQRAPVSISCETVNGLGTKPCGA